MELKILNTFNIQYDWKTIIQFHNIQYSIKSGQKTQSEERYCSMLKTNFRASLEHCSKYINCKQIPNSSNIFKSEKLQKIN